MRIAKIETQAFKWNGEIFARVYTQGCNCKCKYCFLPELIPRNGGMDGKSAIEKIKKNLVMDSVCITGGEPTVHNDLPIFVKRIKLLGLKTMLETNGTNPGVLEKLTKRNLLDYVRLDLKTTPGKYKSLTGCEFSGTKRSLDLLRNWDGYWEITTVWHPCIGKEDLEKMAEIVGDAKWVILPFIPKNLLDPSILELGNPEIDEEFLASLGAREIWIRKEGYERRIK